MGSIQIACCVLLLTLSVALSICAHNEDREPTNIAIIGEGVIGLSTAMAIKEMDPTAEITIFSDRPFDKILSKGIAGLFRIDKSTPLQRLYGNDTFAHLAKLWRTLGGFSGVQLLSGHILSENKEFLRDQERAYADIVYNFHFLDDRELKSQFGLKDGDKTSGIHYTAFTSEGARYCPWMKKHLLASGVKFFERKIESLDELADDGFPIVVNCAGMNGAQLAGDDYDLYPTRGILLKVDAPWQKHFLMRNTTTFTIPTIGAVYVGTVKEEHKDSMKITKEEIDHLWDRYLQLQPSFKDVKILDHFVGLRPARAMVRVEAETRTTPSGKTYKVVHNYGHGGSGFTLGWGTALHASSLVLNLPVDRYEGPRAAEMLLKKPKRRAGYTSLRLNSGLARSRL
uniref:DAO domain-containing protein n=1 Tax=Haemonchus contortus TaxID=6289 RepID=A0A7I4XTS1_HAECO|nr:FAD dependent oxidoreductase domain containing protein [Haemonchus contortus]